MAGLLPAYWSADALSGDKTTQVFQLEREEGKRGGGGSEGEGKRPRQPTSPHLPASHVTCDVISPLL